MLDKNAITEEQKALFIIPAPHSPEAKEAKLAVLEPEPAGEEEEKALTLSQSGATGAESEGSQKVVQKKKRKKRRKKKDCYDLPLLDEILTAYAPEEASRTLLREKVAGARDVCELLFGMYLSNKEAGAKALQLEIQVRETQLKLAEAAEREKQAQAKYERMKEKYEGVKDTLASCAPSLERAVEYQKERLKVDQTTIEERRDLIKQCMLFIRRR